MQRTDKIAHLIQCGEQGFAVVVALNGFDSLQ